MKGDFTIQEKAMVRNKMIIHYDTSTFVYRVYTVFADPTKFRWLICSDEQAKWFATTFNKTTICGNFEEFAASFNKEMSYEPISATNNEVK